MTAEIKAELKASLRAAFKAVPNWLHDGNCGAAPRPMTSGIRTPKTPLLITSALSPPLPKKAWMTWLLEIF